MRGRFGFLSDLDHIACFYKVRRDVDSSAINAYMLVANDLSCFLTGSCKTKSENNIVKAGLQHNHQVLTGLALHLACLCEIVTERLLQYAIDKLCLLLLSQLKAIFGFLSGASDLLSLGLFMNAKVLGLKTKASASL